MPWERGEGTGLYLASTGPGGVWGQPCRACHPGRAQVSALLQALGSPWQHRGLQAAAGRDSGSWCWQSGAGAVDVPTGHRHVLLQGSPLSQYIPLRGSPLLCCVPQVQRFLEAAGQAPDLVERYCRLYQRLRGATEELFGQQAAFVLALGQGFAGALLQLSFLSTLHVSRGSVAPAAGPRPHWPRAQAGEAALAHGLGMSSGWVVSWPHTKPWSPALQWPWMAPNGGRVVLVTVWPQPRCAAARLVPGHPWPLPEGPSVSQLLPQGCSPRPTLGPPGEPPLQPALFLCRSVNSLPATLMGRSRSSTGLWAAWGCCSGSWSPSSSSVAWSSPTPLSTSTGEGCRVCTGAEGLVWRGRGGAGVSEAVPEPGLAWQGCSFFAFPGCGVWRERV